MKKLMIAAAIVCAAALSHGAVCAWNQKGTDGIGLPDASDIVDVGTAVYLMNATTDQDALVKALTGAAYESTVSASKIALGATNDDGVFKNPSGTTTLAGGLTDVEAYYVLFSGDKMFVSDAEAMSWVATGDGKYKIDFSTDNTDASWGGTAAIFDAKDGFQGAGWYQAAAVPEPTSGLLLLLGVAGLALRRRRA